MIRFCLCLLFVLTPSSVFGQQPPDPNSSQEQNKRWKRVLYWKQRTRLLKLQKQEGGLLAAIERLDRQSVAIAARLKLLRRQAQLMKVQVKKSHRMWLQQQKKSRLLLKKIQPRLRLFYRLVRLGRARLLMGAKSLKNLAYRWRALHLATVKDFELLRAFQKVRHKARNQAKQWKNKETAFKQLLAMIKRQNLMLIKQRRDKALTLQSLYKEVHLYRRVLQNLRGSGKSLLSMLHKWQQKAPVGGLALLRGQIPWPIFNYSLFCAKYKLKQQGSFYSLQCLKKMTTARSVKGLHQRPGMTLPVPSGTPILSIASGKCVHQGWIRGYGQVVLLDHGQKFYSLYAHLSYISIQKGQLVEAKNAIGLSGATGMLGKPVLYFELRHHSRVLPALKWLIPTKK